MMYSWDLEHYQGRNLRQDLWNHDQWKGMAGISIDELRELASQQDVSYFQLNPNRAKIHCNHLWLVSVIKQYLTFLDQKKKKKINCQSPD